MTDGRPARPVSELFKFAVEPLAPLYRAVMGAFLAAKERYELRLRPHDLHLRLPKEVGADLAPEALERALDQLAAWSNLKRIPDTSRARNLDEFLKRRSLYQLTPEGETAERAVRQVEATFGDRGALQAFMLPEVLDDLRELVARARSPEPDAGRLHAALSSLFAKFDELADNAGRFMATLNEEIDRGDLADAGFRAYKQAVVVYLDRFLAQLSLLAPQTKESILDLEEVGLAPLFELAASADAAPTTDGQEPRIADALASRWDGLRRWFVGAGQDVPVMDGLRTAGIDAARRLLGIVEHINDRRYKRVNRATDLVQLARWFETADDARAHELYRVAFGLDSARHLGAPVDDDSAGPQTSWWAAPVAEVAATMRARGRPHRTGRVGAITDRSDAKRLLLERAGAERVRRQRAAVRFAGRGPVRMGDIEHLDAGEFTFLLHLIERALTGAHNGRATTSDGAFEVTLSQPGDAGRRALIATETGSLDLPDFLIEVRPSQPSQIEVTR